MGEVIEINIIAQQKAMLKKLVKFMATLKREHIIGRTIEIMDDWEYKNVFQCDDLKDVDQYLDDKIICITEMFPQGIMGVTSECINEEYIFCVWYNFKCDITKDEYIYLNKNFIEYLSTDLINDGVKLCGIGKETIFTYAENVYQVVEKSHNIDIWIVNKNVYQKNCFNQCRIYSLEEYSYDIESAVIIF